MLTPRLVDRAARVKKVVFEFSTSRVAGGGTIEVPLKVSGFEKVTGFQFTLGWNARLLRFRGLQHDGVVGLESSHFNLSNAANGRLVCSWDDVSGIGQTLADGSVLLRLKFNATDTPSAVSPVRFLSTIAAPKITVESILADAAFLEGLVWIGTGPEDVRLLTPLLRSSREPETGAGTVEFAISSAIGLTYVLECSNSLSEPLWRTLKGFSGDGRLMVISDHQPVVGHRFYRLRTIQDLGSGDDGISAQH